MFEQVATHLPVEICSEFRLALMRGAWSNGLRLTEQQRRTCEQALFYQEGNQQAQFH
ncbi:MAG: DUF1315 family protein [Gammaproteobacteria bacterium]|nr:DUF1315 family protein [Gammaproteobacteria bacterium]